MNHAPENPSEPEEAPGVPGLTNWRRVYFATLGCLAAYILLLFLFSRAFT